MVRGDFTDAHWARLEPLLPAGRKTGRPRKWSRRRLLDGIRWRTRTGTP
ncbi:transposase [Streptomyces rubiginosohelvolus]